MIEKEDVKFIEALNRRPSLRKRFEEILQVAEGDDSMTADEAEERAVEEVRKLGQEMLQEWAVSRQAKKIEEEKYSKGKKQEKKTLLANDIWKSRN